MLMFAEASNITAARVTKKAELREAIEKMLKTPGPYLLDVMVPHQAQVLQLIQQMQFYYELSSTNTIENKK